MLIPSGLEAQSMVVDDTMVSGLWCLRSMLRGVCVWGVLARDADDNKSPSPGPTHLPSDMHSA